MTHSRPVLVVYLAAETFSFFSNALIALVLPWLVLLRTGDPAMAALVAAVAACAQMAATALSGALIDRFGGRRMAALADFGSAASVIGLVLVDVTFGLSVPWLLTLAIAGAFFDVPGMTARQTLLPRVAERSGVSLDVASGMRQSVFGLSFLLGPAAAGVMLAALGPAPVLWITAVCALLAAIATLGIRVPEAPADPGDRTMRGAWATVRSHPVIVRVLAVGALAALVSAPILSVLMPAHFVQEARADLLGYVASAFAVGIVAGSALYALVARISRRLAWTAALLLVAGGLITMAFLGGFWSIATGAAIVGLGSGLVSPLFSVIVGERVPTSQLGRVMSLTNVIGLSAAPAGLGIATVILVVGDLSTLAWTIAAGWVLVTALGLFGTSLRQLKDRAASETAAPGAASDPAAREN